MPPGRSSTGCSSGPAMAGKPARDVFIVANNIEELGGAIRFAHTLAGLLSAQGHRVTLIGVSPAHEVFDYGSDLPYATHVLHDRHPPANGPSAGLARLDPRVYLRRG